MTAHDRNPTMAQPGWPAVVVGGAYYTAINLMRSLARRGVKAFCFDHGQNRQAFHTTYGKAFECPDPDREPAAWLEFMLRTAQRVGGKPVLIPSADVYVSAMSAHAEALAEAYVFCRESVALQGLLATKEKQYELAARHGMPLPFTRYVRSPEDLTEFASQAVFPCLIKPVRSYEWRSVPRDHLLARQKVAVALSAGELEEKYRTIAEICPDVVAQEVIEGPASSRIVYLSCYSTSGNRIARSMMRSLRLHPIGFGDTSLGEPVDDPEVDRLCDGFLTEIRYSGLCEISVKRDSRDGKLRMIEANPRFTGASYVALAAGVELGWIHYLDLIGQKVEPVEPTRRDFRYVALTLEAKSIGRRLKTKNLTWRELVRSYRPPLAFFDLDIRDWRLAARTLFTILYLVIGRPIRRFFFKSYRY